MATQLTGFLLTSDGRDTSAGFEIVLHARTGDGRRLIVRVTDYRPLFFVERDTPAEFTATCLRRKALPLLALDVVPTAVDCLYFATSRAARQSARQLRERGITVYESDVRPVERFLMERDIRGSFTCEGELRLENGMYRAENPVLRGCAASTTRLTILSLDIETNADTGEIYSIACAGETDVVFVSGSACRTEDGVRYVADEAALLRAFVAHVKDEDPDIILGWYVIDFDLHTLQQRCAALAVPFDLGREGACSIEPSANRSRGMLARIPGRVVVDVPTTLRSLSMTFEEYSLDFVADALLGRRKQITLEGRDKIEEIKRRYRDDKAALAQYNLDDARLARAVFDKADLLANAMERSRLTGHLLDGRGGSVASFDFLYLPRLHRAGYVAIDTADVQPADSSMPGGLVMEPVPGLHENVLVFDFRSLYPSLIVTFNIDPLARLRPSDERLTGPSGVAFARERGILPEIIAHLLEQRAEAKRGGNAPLSHAIKILMNSFYGVLGTTGCRFFAAELAQTITGTGQFVLLETRRFIEGTCGLPVIYGDTDSLFVALGPEKHEAAQETGRSLAERVNAWLADWVRREWAVDSALKLQFESHFRHFLLPYQRGSDTGSKKHYCGVVEEEGRRRLVFKGMESVRSDWTPMAQEFQQELCLRIFYGQPVEEYVRSTVAAVVGGQCDAKLQYRKRLRKDLDDYTVNVPPHVQAAKLMESPGHVIRYFMTTRGPQPAGGLTAPLDYEHYVSRQLAPVADSLLVWRGTSLNRIMDRQLELFDPVG